MRLKEVAIEQHYFNPFEQLMGRTDPNPQISLASMGSELLYERYPQGLLELYS